MLLCVDKTQSQVCITLYNLYYTNLYKNDIQNNENLFIFPLNNHEGEKSFIFDDHEREEIITFSKDLSLLSYIILH